MEIPFSRFHNLSLDQIETSFKNVPNLISDCKFLTNKSFSFLYKYDFSFPIRTCISRVTSSSLKQPLLPKPNPKPKPKPNKLPQNLELHKDSQHTQITKSNSYLCNEIEKLVRFRKYKDALELFHIVESEGNLDVDDSTYDALVNACIHLRSIKAATMVRKHMINNGFVADQFMNNRVLLMFVKCGMIKDARRLFDEMPTRNVVSWNIIIMGLVDSGDYEVAFDLFIMLWRNEPLAGTRTFVTMIRAAASLGSGYAGRQLHSNALKLGIDQHSFVACGLINMYSKCGSLVDAQSAFDEMHEKSVVAWNTIASGYALQGYSEAALRKYYEMQAYGVKRDHFTYSMLISVSARLASAYHARQAHAGLLRNGFGSDLAANAALVDFYGKWGKIQDARRVFDRMPHKNLTAWNAMIAGYSNHGKGIEAVLMFEQMLRVRMVPDHVTFLAVLSGCANSGLSDKGWEIFESMEREYRVKPRAMHYACMMQLLGRKGLLDEALALTKHVPFRPTENMWAALLNASRIHENLELGKFAAEKLCGMEPEKVSNYVVLCNIYRRSGKSEKVAQLAEVLRRKGVTVLSMCSWIEIKKHTHCFHFGDTSHVQTAEIYQKVDELMEEVAKHGYVPAGASVLPDVEKQEEPAFYHSEKLAIAFGLINTPSSTSLRLVQGHRVCPDCHNVIKLIALITGREIVIRDANRFHHFFKDGTCSCGDYW